MISITLSIDDWQKVKSALLNKANHEAEVAVNLRLPNTQSKHFNRIYEVVDRSITEAYTTVTTYETPQAHTSHVSPTQS